MLFIGVAKITLEKKSSGSEGRAIIFAVGLALAIGMAVVEKSFGFNLGSLGAVSISMLLILFGIMLFFLLEKAGLKKCTSLLWAFILAYVLLQLISPELSSWIISNFPIIDALFLIGCLIAIIKLILSLSSERGLKKSYSNLLSLPTEQSMDFPLNEEEHAKKGLKNERAALSRGRDISNDIRTGFITFSTL